MSVCAVLTIVLTVKFLTHLSAPIFYTIVISGSLLLILSQAIPRTGSALYRLFFLVNVLLPIVIAIYIGLYYSGFFERATSIELLRETIAAAGGKGVFILFLLTVLQVVILPIPAAVTILIGVFIYGPTISFIVSTLGTILGSIICYFIGKKLGYKAVAWIIGKEKTEKYTKIVAEKGKIPFVVMMLFPFFPDDILCMVAGLTVMPFKFFILAVSLARPVMIAFFSYFGTGKLIPFSGWGIPVWITLIAFVFFVLYLMNYLINKNKDK